MDWDLRDAAVQLADRAFRLARFLRLRLRGAWRHGMSHPGRAEHGADARRSYQRRMPEAGGQERFYVSEEIHHPLRFPRARYDARGQDFLVRRHVDAPPRPNGLAEGEVLGDPAKKPAQRTTEADAAPADSNAKLDAEVSRLSQKGSNGSLFVGDKGFLTTGTYGEKTRLVPAARMEDYKFPEPLLTRSPGHYRDWIRAAKGGDRSCSDFSVAAPFTEWILLGAISLRFEGRLEWDSAKMKITNNAAANELIKPKFRKGWQFT